MGVITHTPLDAPRQLLGEVALWKDLGEVVSGGVLDEGYPKPQGEVLVSGSAHSATGEPVTGIEVRLGLERGGKPLVDKRLVVVGNRHFDGSKPSEPVPFVSLPIDWAHAFGGEGHAPNPLGKGAAPLATEHGPVQLLPNVEDPRRPVAHRDDCPAPAGFGAYPLDWPQRFCHVGTDYGSEWLRTLYPGPAADFDPRFYCVAPEDQRIEGFFSGKEHFVLAGMHPRRQLLAGHLLPVKVRVFATQRRERDGLEPEERFVELATRIDTLHFFPDRERVVTIHRGTIDEGDRR